jgi:hypothetical protein
MHSHRVTSILASFSLFFSTAVFAQTGTNVGAAAAASKPLNPDMSINFLGVARMYSGFALQEAEMQFIADVDPYFRANALFAVSKNATTGEYGIAPEEIFFETISIPSLTVKAGKFKAALTRHNLLHSHAFPFISAPIVNTELLGDEGLNNAGISAAALVPLPWFSEFTLQGFTNSSTPFNSGNSGDWIGVAQFRNLWDLNDDLTLEFNLSGAQGKNSYAGKTNIVASDLIFKWRPAVGGKYQALIWQSEFLSGTIQGKPSDDSVDGWASWLQYQFAQRWWAQARYDMTGMSAATRANQKKRLSFLVGFFPSEFSGFRLEYGRTEQIATTDHALALQFNISIGAHPAHAY